jgi:putative thioredoxin
MPSTELLSAAACSPACEPCVTECDHSPTAENRSLVLPGIVLPVAIDVSDADFEQTVLDRSEQVTVVVDLWAPWCGPCRTLGPILEDVVAQTDGTVELAKVNVDENPQISAAFQVQSIPAVVAIKDRKAVDGFVGALPRHEVEEFIARLAPVPSETDQLVAAGDEASLRAALDIQADHPAAVVGLARILLDKGEPSKALQLLGRIPENAESRQVAAEARLAEKQVEVTADGVESLLDQLLDRVKEDETARQEFVDLLETLGSDDPRTSRYRKALAARLF